MSVSYFLFRKPAVQQSCTCVSEGRAVCKLSSWMSWSFLCPNKGTKQLPSHLPAAPGAKTLPQRKTWSLPDKGLYMVKGNWRVQPLPGLHVSIMVFTFIHSCMHAFTLKMFIGHPQCARYCFRHWVSRSEQNKWDLCSPEADILVEMQKQTSQLVDK